LEGTAFVVGLAAAIVSLLVLGNAWVLVREKRRKKR
jgi:hypothetical protein